MTDSHWATRTVTFLMSPKFHHIRPCTWVLKFSLPNCFGSTRYQCNVSCHFLNAKILFNPYLSTLFSVCIVAHLYVYLVIFLHRPSAVLHSHSISVTFLRVFDKVWRSMPILLVIVHVFIQCNTHWHGYKKKTIIKLIWFEWKSLHC